MSSHKPIEESTIDHLKWIKWIYNIKIDMVYPLTVYSIDGAHRVLVFILNK